MRKGVLVVGLIALVLAASGTPLVLSQMQTPSDEPETGASVDVDSERLGLEIAVLRAINDMDLSADQLETLHAVVSDLRSERDQVIDAQRSLRDFLVQFEGNRDEYHDAVQAYEDKLSQARSEFRRALQDAIDTAKGTLTIRQGQILREHLRRSLGSASGRAEIRTRVESARPQIGDRQAQGECLTERLSESMDGLRERLEAMLDRFGLDGWALENWKRDWQDHVVCLPTSGESYRPDMRSDRAPQVEIRMNPDRLRDLMTDHLDTLEQVLAEKLSAPRSTQASALGESTIDQRTLIRTS